MRQLSGKAPNPDEERLSHLQNYLLACINQSMFSWADLMNGRAKDRLFSILSKDIVALGSGTWNRAKQFVEAVGGFIVGGR